MGHLPGLSSLFGDPSEHKNTFSFLMRYDDLPCFSIASHYNNKCQEQETEFLYLLHCFIKLSLSIKYCALSAIASLHPGLRGPE
jgi:hypothetical protein